MTLYTHFVGIDIAAQTFTAAWGNPLDRVLGTHTFPQTAAGFEALMQQVSGEAMVDRQQTLVVMEASGSYWMPLAWALHQANFQVSVINPAQAHAFARVKLQRAKTDRLDAQLLLQLAQVLQPLCWTPPPAIYAELQQRLAQRDAFIETRTRERNRLHALQQQPMAIAPVQARLQAHLDFLQQQIEALEAEIKALLLADHAWAQAAALLRTIPGVGAVTATCLLTATLNFACCDNPEQAAAYAGLVPHPRQSGTSLHAHRPIGHGGHARLRTALYMATLTAIRCNPVIRTFYRRLLERGKLKKVALCAAARKLLHLCWAVVTKQRPFDPNYRLSLSPS